MGTEERRTIPVESIAGKASTQGGLIESDLIERLVSRWVSRSHREGKVPTEKQRAALRESVRKAIRRGRARVVPLRTVIAALGRSHSLRALREGLPASIPLVAAASRLYLAGYTSDLSSVLADEGIPLTQKGRDAVNALPKKGGRKAGDRSRVRRSGEGKERAPKKEKAPRVKKVPATKSRQTILPKSDETELKKAAAVLAGPNRVVTDALFRMKRRNPREVLFSIGKLREEIGDVMTRERVDAGIVGSAMMGDVYLTEHDHPRGASKADRDAMLRIGARWYNGISLSANYVPPSS